MTLKREAIATELNAAISAIRSKKLNVSLRHMKRSQESGVRRKNWQLVVSILLLASDSLPL